MNLLVVIAHAARRERATSLLTLELRPRAVAPSVSFDVRPIALSEFHLLSISFTLISFFNQIGEQRDLIFYGFGVHDSDLSQFNERAGVVL
jgi:hypothetical protein